jgi:hypothetical protein
VKTARKHKTKLHKALYYLIKGLLAVVAVVVPLTTYYCLTNDDFIFKQWLTINAYLIPILTPVAAFVFLYNDYRLRSIEEYRRRNGKLY